MRTRFPTTLLTIATLLGGSAWTPASAQSIPAVDTDRLLHDISVLAADSMAGRETATPGAERARVYITRRLEEIGLAPFGDSYRFPFTWSGHPGVDLVATTPGRDPDADVIVISAHYDHVGIRDGRVFNGADDNASGVAALLEVARRVRDDPLEHPTILAFFDAEEEGQQGSRAFVSDPSVPLDRVALVVNLDMVSRTNGVLWASGTSHTPSLAPILDDVAGEAPLVLRLGHDRPGAPEGEDWTNSSDHSPFFHRGIPYVYFGVENHPDYHRPTDDVEKIDPHELTTSVQTILMAIRALDAALPLGRPSPK